MELTVSEFFTHLCTEKNFYGHCVNHMQRIEAPGIRTMAIGIQNYRICFFYDPAFIKAISMRLGVFAVEHEVVHAILDHIPRYIELLATIPDGVERAKAAVVFNLAVDCAANSLLRKNHKNFDKIQEDFRAYIQTLNPDEPLSEEAGMVLPERYDLPPDSSFEFYQRELMKTVKVMTKEQFDALCKAIGESVGESHQQWEGSSQEGDGKGLGNKDEDQEGKGSGNGTNFKNAVPQELEGMAQQVRSQMKNILKNAVREQRKGRGTIPGEIKELLEEYLKDPIIPWWHIFTSRITATKRSKPDRGISRPNRALLGMSEEDASIIPSIGKARDPRFRVFFYVDTSGSMSTESLNIALSELTHMLRTDDDLEVRYMQGDTQTHFDQVFKSGETLPQDAHGRGGTDFNAYFEYMGKYFGNDETAPDIVIVYTDGYAPAVEPRFRLPPETPVIWLMTRDHSSRHLQGYGEVIVCDAEHNAMRQDEDEAA